MEWQLFPAGTVPEWTTPEWYANRDAAPHLEQEGHSDRLQLTAMLVQQAIQAGADQIIDLGAGDGGLLSILPHDIKKFGYDLQQSNVDAAAGRGQQVSVLDVVSDPSWKELVTPSTCLIATEMLEHLIDPHDFVSQLFDTGAHWLVASSPYTETDAQHYEYHTWAWDQAGYTKMLIMAKWITLRQQTAWISQVVLARRRGRPYVQSDPTTV